MKSPICSSSLLWIVMAANAGLHLGNGFAETIASENTSPRRMLDSGGSIPAYEYAALYDLYNSTNGADWLWTPSLGVPWNFANNSNPCAGWQGVFCYDTDPTYVNILRLSSMNLAGTLPDSLGVLEHLTTIQADSNAVSGTIPDTVYNILTLTSLVLDNNNINGSISNRVCNLSNLQKVDFHSNSVTGTIPACLDNLGNLSYISLGYNSLTGTIPDTFGNMPYVKYLYLNNNFLRGTLPTSLSNLQQILYLELSTNYLTGTIPAQYGSFANVIYLSIYKNSLSGSIPNTFHNLSHLNTFVLGQNDLSGTIPEYVCTLSQVAFVDFSFNHLNGTVPSCIGNLTLLQSFYGFNNMFTGTIPASLGKPRYLTYLELNNNKLSGSIPDTFNSPFMYILDISHNALTGAIPSSFGTMSHVVYLNMENNMLTGSIPSTIFTTSSELFSLDVSSNRLTGHLPDASAINIPVFNYLNVFSNYLTGTLPDSYGTLSQLRYLFTYYNIITGTIPISYTNLNTIEQLYLSSNLLSGTIPALIGSNVYTQFLALDNNILTGTIPSSISTMGYLFAMFIQLNHLTGTLDHVFNHSLQFELATVVLHSNQLTGTLPEEVFNLYRLNSFSAVRNCFHGSFPSNMCNATGLSSLALDGLTSASTCRNTLFPGLSNAYVVTRRVGTTIPECLFSMPILTTLHLSGNGLTGTLPDVRISPLLIDLALSHNILTGTIPIQYQRRQWYDLDLSYNRFSGSLHIGFESQVLNATFFESLSHIIGINVSQETAQSSLSLENNRLSGQLPHTIQVKPNVSVLGSNVFSCNVWERNLPVYDSGRDNYQCGSDSFNVPFYIWMCGIFVAVLLVVVLRRYREYFKACLGIENAVNIVEKWQSALWVHSAVLEPTRRLVAYMSVQELSRSICVIGVRCTVYIVVVLMPLYTIASIYSGTLLHQYAWTVSAAYLSGVTVAALQIVFLVGLLSLVIVCYVKCKHWQDRAPDLRTTSVDTKPSVSDKKPTMSACTTIIIYTGFLLLNLVAVVGANVAYVYVVIYGQNNILLFAQFALSCFKLFWNRFFSVYLIRWTARVKAVMESRNVTCVDGTNTTGSSVTPANIDQFVTLQMFVSLLNNIGIPCLVVAGISPSCFYELFKGAPVIHTHYSFDSCSLVDGASCTVESASFMHVTYTPPFTYNYQCSSSFITYYAPTYVIVCIMCALISPLVQFSLYHLHRDATPGTQWHRLLTYVLLRNLRSVTSASDIKVNVFRPHFDANQMLLSLFTYTGLLLTFGAMFPPVALALLVTLLSTVYFNKLLVGRILSKVAEKGILEYVDVIEVDCQRAGFLLVLHRVVWMLVTVCCWFYTLFIFDTLGDSVGFEGAYWVLIVMPLMPLFMYCTYRAVMQLQPVCYQLQREGGDHAAGIDCLETANHNVLHESVVDPEMEMTAVA